MNEAVLAYEELLPHTRVCAAHTHVQTRRCAHRVNERTREALKAIWA